MSASELEPENARRTGRGSTARGLLVALVAPLVLLGPVLVRGELFLPVLPVSLEPLRSERPEAAAAADEGARWVLGDRLLPFLTDQVAIRDEVRAGAAPTWEPLLGIGMPLLGGSLVAPLYPPNALAVLVPPERAAGPLACLSLVLAGLGTALLLARLGLSPGAVACGTLATGLGGWGVANLFYFMKVDAALWLPWALWAVEGVVRGKRWSGIALALAIGLSFLAGFVPLSVFVALVTAAWALVRSGVLARPRADAPRGAEDGRADDGDAGGRGRGLRVLGACMLFVALGGLVASAQVLPMLETSRWSARTQGGDLLPQSLPRAALLGTVVPELFGSTADSTPAGGSPVAWWLTAPDEWFKAELWNPLEWNAYAGAVVVLLALVAVVATPRRAAFPGLALACVLGFALGAVPFRWLWALPGLDLGAPGRVLGLAWLLWPWLAALGVEALVARAPRAFGTLLAGGFVLAAALFVLWIGVRPERFPAALEALLVERYGERFGQTVADVRARIPPERSLAAARGLRDALAHGLGAALSACAAGAVALVAGREASTIDRRATSTVVGRGARGRAGVLVLGTVVVVALGALPPLATRGGTLWPALLAALVAAALVALLARRRGSPAAWTPLAAAIAVEGVLAAAPSVGGIGPPTDELFPPSPSIDAVREAAGDGAVLRFDASPSGVEEAVRLARPNLLVPYGVRDLTGYVVFIPRGLRELFRELDPRALFRRHVSRLSDPALLDHPLLDLLRVRAILSVDPLPHPRLEPVLERPGFHVYRRTGALPPARIVPRAEAAASDAEAIRALAGGGADLARTTLLAPEHARHASDAPVPPGWQPGAIEDVRRPTRNRLELDVWGSSGGWLVLHEQYAPGWKARVNGEEAEVVRADHVCRAVRIPRGTSRVETWYAPPALALGTLVSAAALAAALVLGALLPRFLRAAPSSDGPAGAPGRPTSPGSS